MLLPFSNADLFDLFARKLSEDETLKPSCLSEECAEDTEFEYDELEWNAVALMNSDEIGSYCEAVPCEEELKEYVVDEDFDGLIWTLYAHCITGGVIAIHDFETKSECIKAYETLRECLEFKGKSAEGKSGE